MSPLVRPDPSRADARPARPREVLVVSADPVLGARAVTLAREAGGVARLVHAPPPARAWAAATVVLLGADAAGTLPDGLPAPPGGVVLVADAEGELPLPGPDGGDPASPLWRLAAAAGASEVALLPGARDRLLERLVAALLPPPTAAVVGVVGGRGGAGASTLAVSLAATAAAGGAPVVLLDLDPFGGGVDLLLGAEGGAGLRWPDLEALRGRVPPGALTAGLPCSAGVHHLTWGRDDPPTLRPDRAAAVLDAAAREAALVVLDLPRSADPAVLGVVEAARLLLIVPAEVRAAASARRVASLLGPLVGDLRLVVRGPAPTGLPAEAVADCLGLPLAGELRPEPGLGAALDRGDLPGTRPRGPLAVLSRRVVAEVLTP